MSTRWRPLMSSDELPDEQHSPLDCSAGGRDPAHRCFYADNLAVRLSSGDPLGDVASASRSRAETRSICFGSLSVRLLERDGLPAKIDSTRCYQTGSAIEPPAGAGWPSSTWKTISAKIEPPLARGQNNSLSGLAIIPLAGLDRHRMPVVIRPSLGFKRERDQAQFLLKITQSSSAPASKRSHLNGQMAVLTVRLSGRRIRAEVVGENEARPRVVTAPPLPVCLRRRCDPLELAVAR